MEELEYLEPDEREDIMETRAEKAREEEEEQQFFYTLRARRIHEIRVKALANNIIQQILRYQSAPDDSKLNDIIRWAQRIKELENDV